MDELLCVIELLIVTCPQHIIDKSFKVQESPLLLKTLTPKNGTQTYHIELLIDFYVLSVPHHLMCP